MHDRTLWWLTSQDGHLQRVDDKLRTDVIGDRPTDIRDIESFAGVKMGPGTLYGALAKLEESGLIEALPEDDRRRPYRVTATGLELLRGRLSESARLAALGLARIAGAAS